MRRPGPQPLLYLALGLLIAAAGVALVLEPAAPPSFAGVQAAFRPSEAYLLDRRGEVLDTERVDFGVRRLTWARLAEISPALISAVVEGEDRRFWHHAGVDWLGVAGAVRASLLDHHRRGASTVTMQLASLLIQARPTASSRRTWMQKLQQTRLALGLELRWSKAQILEAYLNLLPFRGELQGIDAASRVLAHKAPSGLSVAESRVLAALLPSPMAGAQRVADRACARLGAASGADECALLRQTAALLLAPGSGAIGTDRPAPHLAHALLTRAGQSVPTTLDAAVQRTARDALARQLAALSARNVRDGAVLVIDNESGDVLAYVGSGGPNSRAPRVDGVRAPRQAGSTLKPFLYELALEKRYLTAASLLEDAPVNIDTASGTYFPQDYEHVYLGPVSVRTALAGSLNVPAVRTLMLVGVDAFRTRLRQLGYQGINQEAQFYGYSLALGSAEVTLWEQAQAYRTLARQGRSAALRIRLADPLPATRSMLTPGASFIVSDVLSDPAARAVTFGLDNSLATGYWSAVKTGTSKDMRDNWCIGFTPRYTVAVWVGNFEGDSMQGVSGVSGAAPVWREIMDSLEHGLASVGPVSPATVVSHPARFASGVEANRAEWFLTGTEPRGAIASVAREAQVPRIASPTNGTVVAMDPDIPADRQRIAISVRGGEPGLLVRINELIVGSAQDTLLWEPRIGAQRVALETRTGQVLDRILFTVR